MQGAFRPAGFVHELVQMGEEKLRAIVFAVWLGWGAFVALGTGGLALLTWALQGPWWLYWVAGVLAVGLLAPVVFVGLVALAALRAWKEKAGSAARVEDAVWGRGPGP